MLGEAGKRAASGMLPGPARRVYESVHGGEAQGVCTARAGRAPHSAPVPAAQRASADTVQDPGPGAAGCRRGMGGSRRMCRAGSAPAVQRVNTESRRPQIGNDVARVSKHRRQSASPLDLNAPRQGERALPLAPRRVPRAVCGTTTRAGIKGEGLGVAWPGRTNGPGRGARGRSSGAERRLASWPSGMQIQWSHVAGAGTTSCWRPTRGGEGGASAPSGWSWGRGVLVS